MCLYTCQTSAPVLVVFGSNNVVYSLNSGPGTPIKHFRDAISFDSLAGLGVGEGTSLFYRLKLLMPVVGSNLLVHGQMSAQ